MEYLNRNALIHRYEDHGAGYIITPHNKLTHFVSAMTQQHAIESKFTDKLVDNLNAEISLGTVQNVDEAVKWLSYTYLYIRMKKNPFNYGIDLKVLIDDPTLLKRRQDLIIAAAKRLHQAQMIHYHEKTGQFTSKDLGRIMSGYYVCVATVEGVLKTMKPMMTEADVLLMLSQTTEFENIKSRDEEVMELKELENDPNIVPCIVRVNKFYL